MAYTSKLDWHLAHVRLMLCGVLLGSSCGQVLHALLGTSLPLAQTASCCLWIALAHWAVSKTPYRGKNWF